MHASITSDYNPRVLFPSVTMCAVSLVEDVSLEMVVKFDIPGIKLLSMPVQNTEDIVLVRRSHSARGTMG